MKQMLSLLIEKLARERTLTLEEYEYLIANRTEESACRLRTLAVEARKQYYGNTVYLRGLIEICNVCKNDCLYCGIRRSNTTCERYRLSEEEIFDCCREGYALGFQTFVLQGGEDPYFDDARMCDIVRRIKTHFPNCAVTLSLGERTYDSYRRLYEAGADRYLLRHETANADHYAMLHPNGMSFDNRMRCLEDLKKIGFQTGCGFMVGSPHQTYAHIAQDLKFIETFAPHMCGIGPFIPHKATPFADFAAGTVELTCYLLSVIRLIHPKILLPATTALGSIEEGGREKGILSGANVIMPNLSPQDNRKKYELYNNKLFSGAESAQEKARLEERMRAIGYEVVNHRGDAK